MVAMSVAYIVVLKNDGMLGSWKHSSKIVSVWSSRALADAAIQFYLSLDPVEYATLDVVEKEINVALNTREVGRG